MDDLIEENKENETKGIVSVPQGKQFLDLTSNPTHLLSLPCTSSSSNSSSTSTIIVDHVIEEIDLEMSTECSILSESSSFRQNIATLPWSILKNISRKHEYIVSDTRPKAVSASVAFSIVPSSMLSVICFGSPRETYYDATLVFTFTDGERKSYRINTSVPLIINNIFNYNLSHRHIILTNNEIDSEAFYAQHLHMMNNFILKGWTSMYNPMRLICSKSPLEYEMEHEAIPIYHECQYIVHLLNNFIPEVNKIDPNRIYSPHELYLWLQDVYKKMHPAV